MFTRDASQTKKVNQRSSHRLLLAMYRTTTSLASHQLNAQYQGNLIEKKEKKN